MPRRRSNRSEAALKGWETRRERERLAEQKREARSAAARKGWETRRAAQAFPPPAFPHADEIVEAEEIEESAFDDGLDDELGDADWGDYEDFDEYVIEDPVFDTGDKNKTT